MLTAKIVPPGTLVTVKSPHDLLVKARDEKRLLCRDCGQNVILVHRGEAKNLNHFRHYPQARPPVIVPQKPKPATSPKTAAFVDLNDVITRLERVVETLSLQSKEWNKLFTGDLAKRLAEEIIHQIPERPLPEEKPVPVN